VFSSCDRLDGNENTKDGFRGEALLQLWLILVP
jgi:hypothetical protein